MGQLFPKQANGLSQASIAAGAALGGSVLLALFLLARSGYATGEGTPYDQKVPFSHNHHTTGVGIDCRYCHTSVEESNFAGIPSTNTCMTCHSQIHSTAVMLEPVRESYRTEKSIEWVRVNDLPDFVYFNHSIHVKKGMACVTCHGPVGEMALTWRENSLNMEWCLQCHRAPEQFVRPREEVFSTTWKSPAPQTALGDSLIKEYKIQKLTNCSICHR